MEKITGMDVYILCIFKNIPLLPWGFWSTLSEVKNETGEEKKYQKVKAHKKGENRDNMEMEEETKEEGRQKERL